MTPSPRRRCRACERCCRRSGNRRNGHALGTASGAADAAGAPLGAAPNANGANPAGLGRADADPVGAFAAAHDLSPREREVAALWLTGHGLKYIENALFISEATVKTHLRNIYRKCDTHNRAEIIALFERESGRA